MCGYHTWRAEVLERNVLAQAWEALEKGEAKFPPSESAQWRGLDTEKHEKRLEAQFLKGLESAAAGITSLGRLRSTLEDLDSQRVALSAGLSADSPVSKAFDSGDLPSLLQSWDSLDTQAADHILKALISRVSVGDDTVRLTLNQG
jgi:hypothetical protein